MNNKLEERGFVEILPNPPKLFIDLKYATKKNFTNKQQYRFGQCYMRDEVARALHNVCLELENKGFGICIWDAYRPLSVQKNFQAFVEDKRYVAEDSPHCKGIAIDLTLLDAQGNYLDMGSDFDDFSEKAHHNFGKLDQAVKERRRLLRNVMENNGFEALETEWWHYTYITENEYDSIDIPL